jgi:murein DD-endopeptidase MepM/ murein hydrolase activator NlpD
VMGTRSHFGMRSAAKIIALAPSPPLRGDRRRVLWLSCTGLPTDLDDNAGRMRRLLTLVLGTTLLVGLGSPAIASASQSPAPQSPAPQSPAQQWHWPTDPPRAIVRPFIAPATPYAAGHRGIDISTSTSVVYAPADGIVHFAGVVVDRPVLSIEHSGGLISSFEPVATLLVPGTVVHRDEVIGELLAGHCSTMCLHFGVRLDGQYVSPLKYLGGIPRSVLLPTQVTRVGAPARNSP